MIGASESAIPPLVGEAILARAEIGLLGRVLRANARTPLLTRVVVDGCVALTIVFLVFYVNIRR